MTALNFFKGFLERYKSCCVILVNAILLFVIVNLVVGWYEKVAVAQPKKVSTGGSVPFKFKEYTPELAPVYPGWDPHDVNKLIFETRHVILGYEPFTQFKEEPFTGKYVNVDQRGFRPTSDQGPWKPSRAVKNVFVFGGSTTFGYGVTDHETIASFLQEVAKSSSPSVHTQVYNFGRCSYICSQELILLEKLIQGGAIPDVAVFIDGLNDFAHYNGLPGFTKQLGRFMSEGEIPQWKRALTSLPIIHILQVNSPSAVEDPQQDGEKIVANVIERYKTNKKLIEAICEKFGIRPLFVWQPTPVYKYDNTYNIFGEFDYDAFLPYVRSGYAGAATAYQRDEFGDNFLWLADMQEDLKEPLYVDAVHYSAKMCKLIAERISIVLSEKKILP